MKKIFFILLITPAFFACKKNDADKMTQTPPPPAAPTDSLVSGWTKIPINDSNDLIDIFFINNTGFAVGNGANIFKSGDGGSNWTPIAKPFSGNPASYYVNVGMGNESNAIFVDPLNQLISTHNGGNNFTYATLSDNYISDVFFVNSATAYAAGTNIWKTVDGGDNWMKLYTFTAGGSHNFYSLYFLNEQVGWVFRAGEGLYKTTDGGVNWQLIPVPFDVSRDSEPFFRNADTGYLGSGNNLEKTTNGGTSWSKIFEGTNAFHSVNFVSDNVGYVTDSSRIYKTTDGGNTWTREVFIKSVYFTEVQFTDPNHGWACGTKGTILKYSK